MAILNTFIKQPADTLDYDIDYEEFLTDGDSMSSATATVSRTSGTGTLAVQAVFTLGTRVKVWLSGGDDRDVFKVTVTTTTTLGRVKQDELVFKIREY